MQAHPQKRSPSAPMDEEDDVLPYERPECDSSSGSKRMKSEHEVKFINFVRHNFCITLFVPGEPRRDLSNHMNISNTARTQTRNLFHPKCAPIPLGHSDR